MTIRAWLIVTMPPPSSKQVGPEDLSRLMTEQKIYYLHELLKKLQRHKKSLCYFQAKVRELETTKESDIRQAERSLWCAERTLDELMISICRRDLVYLQNETEINSGRKCVEELQEAIRTTKPVVQDLIVHILREINDLRLEHLRSRGSG